MSRRSRLEIYFDILVVVESGVTKPTQIMYKAGLCWASLQEILEDLIKSKFITEKTERDMKRYQITKKGRNALSYHLKALNGLIDAKKIFAQ